MRYQFRALCLTLSTFLLLYLYITDRLPTSLADLPSFNGIDSNYEYGEIVETGGSYESVQSLWEHWSNIIYKNRPRTQRIHLSSNAHIVSTPSNDNEPRKPPHNRVSNSESDIESLRSSHAAFLETLQSEDIEVGDVFNGTGIVTVGGGEYFGPAIVSLHMLRRIGCTLPVEIFVADTSEYEPALCEEYLPKYGAKCLVLSDFLKDGNGAHRFEVTHYQLKSLAMLFSSFAEILYLDSDSIPVANPSTDLFSTEPYTSNGLVIWPDFWIATESPLFYTIAGLPSFPTNLPKSSSEAGQVLLNKNMHIKTLLLAIYYNIFGPDYYYPLLSQGVLGQGDKETFMAAAVVLEEPYYRVKTGVTSVGRNNGHEFKGSGMIQHYPSDDLLSSQFHQDGNKTVVRPAFVHANTPKMNAGHLVDEGDLFNVKDQTRLRLWGSQAEQNMVFGVDLEKEVWELLVETGCELEGILGEWKGREKMCERLQEHWKEVF